MVDWIVVGAGFTGATLAERLASVGNKKVLVVERRDHIAGNAHDRLDPAGILVHEHGPHIFHTNSDEVWSYLQAFSDWRPYEHRVLADIDGRLAPLPFNFNSIEALFPKDQATRYIAKLEEHFPTGGQVPILKLRNEPDPTLSSLAEFVYQKVFYDYTLKQWGLRPEQLAPSVTARVPILIGRDDRYFRDRHQAMPALGYTVMFGRMLDHPNIKLSLKTNYDQVRDLYPSARTIYSGPIDEFFDYEFGPLPYRSMRFAHETLEGGLLQPVATINHPGKTAHMRVTEMKHLTGQVAPVSTLVREFPVAYVPERNEPYYPIPTDENAALYRRYRELAKQRDDVVFCGRLGEYKYYNMDQAVASALATFRSLVP